MYLFEWKTRVDRSVLIEADSKEEAHKKWIAGDYGPADIDDEEIINDTISIDQEEYHSERHEKVKSAWY